MFGEGRMPRPERTAIKKFDFDFVQIVKFASTAGGVDRSAIIRHWLQSENLPWQRSLPSTDKKDPLQDSFPIKELLKSFYPPCALSLIIHNYISSFLQSLHLLKYISIQPHKDVWKYCLATIQRRNCHSVCLWGIESSSAKSSAKTSSKEIWWIEPPRISDLIFHVTQLNKKRLGYPDMEMISANKKIWQAE